MKKRCGSNGFERFALVGYKDDTGIGRQCHNMQSILQIGFHLVAPSKRLPGHPLHSERERALPLSLSESELKRLISDLEGLIIIERNKWHKSLFHIAKQHSKRVILVPNWEWFDPSDPAYLCVDQFVVHSDYAQQFLLSYGFANTVLLPPPIDLTLLPSRKIVGLPHKFFHNAGIIDPTDRKGTSLVLAAWENKRESNATLLIRYQASAIPFPPHRKFKNVIFEADSKQCVAELYIDGHCAVQPSRLEGLGYMVIEPLLCGIPTITTGRPPMNEYAQGTVFCEALESKDMSYPRQRGIGCAPLFDVIIPTLTKLLEDLESTDVSSLAHEARLFREQFDHTKVRDAWNTLLK